MAERAFTKAMGRDETTARPSIEAPFGAALVEVGRKHPEVVGLTADLGRYTDIVAFRDAFPERFFNVGMAEQNLVAVAAGLARTGYIPFATTYGVFASRRAYDFIAIAVAHSGLPVKIIAGLPGLTTGYGGTHQAIEDTGLMRLIPGLVVIDPCDATEIAAATKAVAGYDGPVYMRLLRGKVPVVFEPADFRFEIGKAQLVRSSGEVGIVSTGLMTERAIDAVEGLAAEGIEAAILHMPTLKPFDRSAVLAFASSVGGLVVAENHVMRGGLATLVAETLQEAGQTTPIARIGLPDRYIECGAVPTLQQRYGLTADSIVAAAKAVRT